jgi:flagellar biosynthesis/type III secretory pathway M-ring protein FliF/YscJ
MDAPIHAANQVDKGETLPRLIAIVAGVLILAVAVAVIVYSGIWNPPATTVKMVHSTPQTQQHG